MLKSDSTLYGWPFYYSLKSSKAGRKEDHDSVAYYANMAIKSYENASIKRPLDEQSLIRAYNNWGRTLEILEDYKGSIELYQNALDLTNRYTFKWKSFIVGGIADNHMKLGNDSLALKYYLETVKDTAYMNIPRSAITTFNYIGGLYSSKSMYNPNLARKYFRKGIKASEDSDYKSDIHRMSYEIGLLFLKEEKKDSAIYYIKKGNEAYNVHGHGDYKESPLVYKYINAILKMQEGYSKEAIKDLNSVIDSYSKFRPYSKVDKTAIDICYEYLIKSYLVENDLGAAFKVSKDQIEFLNMFHKDQIDKSVRQLEVQYQTKEKDASIAQLEENKTQQEKIIGQQRIIAFGLGGLLFLLSSIGYLFWRQRKLKNQYEKENLEQRLLRSQMNPHFVSNALNTVCGLVEKKSDRTIPYVNKMATLFRLTLNNSREEFIGLEEELAALKSYLELQSNFATDFNFDIQIGENIDVEEVVIPPMLIQPFLENAIIHGFSGIKERGDLKIKISKDKTEKLLLCSIFDNGIGYYNKSEIQLKKHKSVSGNIVNERLAILKKKFKVDTRFKIKQNHEKGTLIELYLPFLID